MPPIQEDWSHRFDRALGLFLTVELSLNNSPLTIGSINLQDFEVPTCIRYGGHQRLAIHRLLDGGRVVEPLGPDESEIQFDGVFTGQHAIARARTLDQLRSSGAVVKLTWHSYQYPIILRKFRADYSNAWWISYSLSCVVLMHASGLSSSATTIEAAIASDISTAASALASMGIELGAMSTATTAAGALVLGTTANVQAAAAAAGTLAAVNLAIAAASQAIASNSQGQSDASFFATSVSTQLANVGTLATATTAQSYVGRIAMNINNGDI